MTWWGFLSVSPCVCLSVCLFPRRTHLCSSTLISAAFSRAPFSLFSKQFLSLAVAPPPLPPRLFSSSHRVSPSLPLSLPSVFLWHQCKASIIERCMGVCVSGREGLGTPPAPPAEEALTAEHWGGLMAPPPLLLLLRPSPTSPLTSLLLSHLLARLLSISVSLALTLPFRSLLFNTNQPDFPFFLRYFHISLRPSSFSVSLLMSSFLLPSSLLVKNLFLAFFLFSFFFLLGFFFPPVIVCTHSLGIRHQAKRLVKCVNK